MAERDVPVDTERRGAVGSVDVVLLRRNVWLLAVAAAAPIGLLLGAALGGGLYVAAAAPIVALVALVTAVMWQRNRWPRRLVARASVDATNLNLEGVAAVPRADIREGLLVPQATGPPHVAIARRGGMALDLVVTDEA